MKAPEFLVFGGGPAGAAAAISLARHGAAVTLLERAAVPPFKPGEILESLVRYTLRSLGLLESFEALGTLRVAGNLSLWGEEEPIESAAVLSPHGGGYLVDRSRMEQWLLQEAAAAGVSVLLGRRKVEVDLAGESIRVAWEADGKRMEVHPAAVIDASGRGAGAIGAGRRRRLDSLVALLTYPDRDAAATPDQRLIIESAENGWWYSAPLPNGRTVLAFMTDADLVPRGWQAQARLIADRQKETRLIRSHPNNSSVVVRSYPAATTIRDQLAGRRWIAVGDAAATYDPLLGRGVASALANGEAVGTELARGESIESAISTCAETQRAVFAGYLDDHRKVYARESRRKNSIFWKRRS